MKSNQAPRMALLVALSTVKKLILATLLVCTSVNADPVLHKFELWGTMKSPLEKLIFYQGWTNGFLAARGPRGLELATCLDGLSGEQAVAMIDKRYKNHPEQWSRPIGEQVLQALTVEGGPCEGKNPLQ